MKVVVQTHEGKTAEFRIDDAETSEEIEFARRIAINIAGPELRGRGARALVVIDGTCAKEAA